MYFTESISFMSAAASVVVIASGVPWYTRPYTINECILGYFLRLDGGRIAVTPMVLKIRVRIGECHMAYEWRHRRCKHYGSHRDADLHTHETFLGTPFVRSFKDSGFKYKLSGLIASLFMERSVPPESSRSLWHVSYNLSDGWHASNRLYLATDTELKTCSCRYAGQYRKLFV